MTNKETDTLVVLSRLTSRIHKAFEVNAIASVAVEELHGFTGSPAVGLMLLDKSDNHLKLIASIGLDPFKLKLSSPVPADKVQNDIVFQSGKIQIYSDIINDKLLNPSIRDELVALDYNALATIPVLFAGNVIGVIHLTFKNASAMQESQTEALMTIGITVGNAIGMAEQLEILEKEKRERKFAEDALRDIALAVSDDTGSAYFNSVVSQISKTFSADFVFIGVLDPSATTKTITTIAVSELGEIIDNFSYDLADTPCENVMTMGMCLYTSEVCTQFPKDLLLQQMQIESYAGYPIHDRSGNPIGVLIALYKTPMINSKIIADVIKIYATRASAELERMRVEQALIRSEEHLRLALTAGHTGTWEWDLKSGKIHWSDGVESIFGFPVGGFDGSFDSYRDRIYEDDLAMLEEAIENAISRNVPYRVEHRIVLPDGEIRWILGQGDVIRNTDGNVIGMHGSVIDITERIRSEIELRESDERYRAFIANSSEGIWRGDFTPPLDVTLDVNLLVEAFKSHCFISEANEILANQYGIASSGNLIGMCFNELLDDEAHRHLIQRFIASNYRLEDEELCYTSSDCKTYWVSMSIIGVVENGKLVRVWGTQRDITEKKAHLEALEFGATHDALTKLPNRDFLHQKLKAILKQNTSQKTNLALLLMDLDRFKEINDTLGHHAGDNLLKQIGPRLHSCINQQDAWLVRLGGDEFAIVLNQINSKEFAVQAVKNILHLMTQPFTVEGLKVEIGASIGIAFYPDHGNTTSSLLRCADVAMYTAKRERRGYEIYNSEQDIHSPERLSLMSELGQAIRSNQLVLHYQPKIDLRSNKAIGFEALVRWQHPTLGLIQPGQFIPFAEMGELIKPLTYWVVENALRQWCEWRDKGYLLHLAINLSARNVVDDECPERLTQIIQDYEIDPAYIEFEITETIMMTDPDRALSIIQKIADIGVTISIDDFGTGYSSLIHLKQLPLHALKIDRSFVMHMLESEQDSVIVRSTINLAHSLGLDVIAEGVENPQTLKALLAENCNYAQGFEIGKPVPAAESFSWLRRYNSENQMIA